MQGATPEKHESKLLRFRNRAYTAILLRGVVLIALISLVSVAISERYYTPKMYHIEEDNRNIIARYNILQDRMRTLQTQVDEVRQRDRSVYRAFLSGDTLQIDGIDKPYPSTKYAHLQGDKRSALMTDTWLRMDALTRSIYAASRSLDEVQNMAHHKENMASAIPAIWPIDRTRLKAFYSFGVRQYHPIYKSRRMHRGVDMSADYGVPVYATGDGTVERVEKGRRRRGYGRMVLIDHQFGYKTRYAHLNKIFVKPGDNVTRGQIIGEVGSTGGSTGPHLHYEVIYMGRYVNPVNYFDRRMSSAEYQALMDNIKHNTDLETFEGND